MNKSILIAVLLAIVLSACDRAPANVHALSTDDCGATWKKLDTGTAVPKHTSNPCGYNMAIPNWPMPGEADFKTQFSKGVLTRAKLTYTYQIVDPILFIKNASYLGRMGGTMEISSDDVGKKYEMAENIIIDVVLRDTTTDVTRELQIVDANPAEIENQINQISAKTLTERGVVLSDMALVLEPDDQTRLAIDAVTAMRVYRNAGIEDAGKAIMVARAGATKIDIRNETANDTKK